MYLSNINTKQLDLIINKANGLDITFHRAFDCLKFPEKAIKKLINTNPQATSNHLGCPASSEKRDVVDNSFTYCYTMSFPNLESHDIYQKDPTHKLFINEVGHLWDRVVVSDSNALL